MNAVQPVVHLVDDDASFLQAMSRLLRAERFQVQAYSSATDFLARRPRDTPGCVVVDLQMPGLNGLDLQQELANAGDPIPVVFLTGHGDIPTSVRAMRQGAEDFLTKRAPKADLLAAVKRALERDSFAREQRARLRELRAPFDALTPREREVLAHVLTGQLNKQIAVDLSIDERSVKRHRTSIMTKLQVQSVTELTHLVDQAGLQFIDDGSSAVPSRKGL
jgi:two-component system, LuxR family, response regulator FixJ